MDRRTLLRATIAAPLSLILSTTRMAATSAWCVIVRTADGGVALDPTDGTTTPLRLPDDLRRAQWLPGVERLLLDLGERALVRDPSGSVPDRTLAAPFAVVAGRVIGEDGALLDLLTDRWHRLPASVGPDTPILRHPTHLAAALDARGTDALVLTLSAGPERTPWVAEVPPEASVAIGPDGRSLLVALPDGRGSSQHRFTRLHAPVARPIARTAAPSALLGPIGASDKVLVQVGEAALARLDARGSVEIVPMPGPGRVESWQSEIHGAGVVVAWDADGEIAWWHLRAGEPKARRLDTLPPDLAMAGSSGEARRWAHGAVARRDGLGSGELRLFAVATSTGDLALDVAVDRRLELAATAVRRDGAVLAHVQAGNTRVDLDVVALPGAMRRVSVPIAGAPTAASEIDLQVEGDVVAAELRWGDPDHHAPVVIAAGSSDGDVVMIEGELVGVVPVATT